MNCTGPCDQGRTACPCPEACHRRERMGAPRRSEMWLIKNKGLVVAILAIASAYWLARN